MKRHAHTFRELSRVARRYYKDEGFCGVVAVSVAAQVAFGKAKSILEKHVDQRDYLDCYEDPDGSLVEYNDSVIRMRLENGRTGSFLKNSKREPRDGTPPLAFLGAGKALGFSVKRIKPTGKTLCTAARGLPKQGVYWVWTTRHLTAIEDGQIIDWTTENSRHKVLAVFEITRHFEPVSRAA